jgi:starch synthase
LPKGKVGGVGDVIRDLPVALADLEWQPTVMTPAYGIFGGLPGARLATTMSVDFAGANQQVQVFAIPGPDPRVTQIVFEHALFSLQGAGKIYCDDGADRPFATDASKFALFSAAAATYISGMDDKPDVVHLHDWHTGLYCALRAFDPGYSNLQQIRTVYTIHNLAMQGIRPLDGDESSLQSWFPGLDYDPAALVDPRYANCVNPMRAAIRLADKINTVSATYAEEILRPNDPAHGFEGGEGLEDDLQSVADDGRLAGILNGCTYEKRDRRRPGWRRLLNTIEEELQTWREQGGRNGWIHELALERLHALPKRRPTNVLTSIGRLTSQKTGLFLTGDKQGQTSLENILHDLGNKGCLIMLGSGDSMLEQQVAEIAAKTEKLIFLCGFSETFAEMLYKAGDLFLMPSTFEPCGISQMLAMRAGQPCVVHAVGGLKDTVQDNVDGFSFSGDSPASQARNFAAVVRLALQMKADSPDRWMRIRDRASSARFTWEASAKQYVRDIYV